MVLIPYSAKFSRHIIFVVFVDWPQASDQTGRYLAFISTLNVSLDVLATWYLYRIAPNFEAHNSRGFCGLASDREK